jgi:hypothetical protein
MSTAPRTPRTKPAKAAAPTATKVPTARAARPKARPAAVPAGPPALQALAAPPRQELLEGPTREDLIRRRAFDLYQRNGCQAGHDVDDWLAAEADVGCMMIEAASPAAQGA